MGKGLDLGPEPPRTKLCRVGTLRSEDGDGSEDVAK